MDRAVSCTGFIYMGGRIIRNTDVSLGFYVFRFYLHGWQDNTKLHEILTDIAAKRKLRRGDFANGVLNSYFFERKTIGA